MSDEELCKALRSALWGQGHHINIKAADRIEELERENAKLGREVNMAKYGEPNFAWSIHNAAMDDLQAKLAKAVEALREQSCNCPFNCDWEHDDICPSWLARTALADLEKPNE
jgi:hypothetical protein